MNIIEAYATQNKCYQIGMLRPYSPNSDLTKP